MDAPPGPLGVQRQANGDIVLFWYGLASLEGSTSLDPGIPWYQVPEETVRDGAFHQVVISPQDVSRYFRLRSEYPFRVMDISPGLGEVGVSVHRETLVIFPEPLRGDTVITGDQFHATYAGRRLLSRVELSKDRRAATLFYLEELPSGSRIRVTLNGHELRNASGVELDADGDGLPGGVMNSYFDTANTSPSLDAGVEGYVYASEPSAEGGNVALEGVTITVDGAEETLRTTTDAQGFFRLHPAPIGRFFVHIDGRTATGSQWPDGSYYPFIGKAWSTVAGRTNHPAGGHGIVYLPLIPAEALQTVSSTEPTRVVFSEEVLAAQPELVGVSVTVPANALFADDGARGGRVGMAPVDPDRLPEPLPPGLEMPVVITVQTDGPSNFDQPVPICFPNLPDPVIGQPLPPGSRQSLVSFNHDKGFWEAVGPMRVSADGRLVCSEPGHGIRQPGWHGVSPNSASPPPPRPPSRPPPKPQDDSNCPPGGRQVCGCLPPTQDAELLQACYDAVNDTVLQPCRKLANTIFNEKLKNCKERHEDLGNKAEYKSCVIGALVRRMNDLKRCHDLADDQRANCDLCAAGIEETGGVLSPHSAPVLHRVPLAARSDSDPAEVLMEHLDRLDVLINQSPPLSGEDLFDAVDDLLAEADAMAGGDVGRFLLQSAIEDQRAVDRQSPVPWLVHGNAPNRPLHYLAVIERPSGPFLVRGLTLPYGQYTVFVPRDGFLSHVECFDPVTGHYGVALPDLRPESLYGIQPMVLASMDPENFPDSDGDGLADGVEGILGTNPQLADTDGDGIPDGVEVRQSMDPLDGMAARTGVLATLRTLGPALDVVALDRWAMVAEGAMGVSVFDTRHPFRPIRTLQIDTPGFAGAVASDGRHLAVADGMAGLAIVDLFGEITEGVTRQTRLAGNSVAVSVRDGIAYVGIQSGAVVAVELATGAVLHQTALSQADNLQDLIILGEVVYVLGNSRVHTLSLADGSLTVTATVEAPGGVGANERRMRLSGGGGFLYATFTAGFHLLEIQDPQRPVLVRTHTSQQVAWKQMVPTGSRHGLAAVGTASGVNGDHDVHVYDLGPEGTQTTYVTTLPTPGLAAAIAIHSGLAYVADGDAGLQIVNFLAPDTAGMAPTVQLVPPSGWVSDATVVEGSLIDVGAEVTDDVMVSRVEFYRDDILVAVDSAFPFGARLRVPYLDEDRTRFTFRARAVDTGGNTAESLPWEGVLTPDITPPWVRRVSPQVAARRVTELFAYFSESLDPATVTPAAITLVEAGPDHVLGTADDHPVSLESAGFDPATLALSARLADPLPFGRYRITLAPEIADRRGNLLGSIDPWDFRVIDANVWRGGDRNEVNNPDLWTDGVLPGPQDAILVEVPPDETWTWTWTQSPWELRSARILGSLVLHNSHLHVTDDLFIDGRFRLSAGKLSGAKVRVNPAGIMELTLNPMLEDVSIYGTITGLPADRFRLAGTIGGAGRLLMGSSEVSISTDATVHGIDLQFASDTGIYPLTIASGATLTLGATSRLLGGRGEIRGDGTFRNLGWVQATGADASLALRTRLLDNQGTIESADGANLHLEGTWGGGGIVRTEGGTVRLGGSFTLASARIHGSPSGSVQITGTLDLNMETLVLDATSGSWNLSGGTLRNGTVELRDGVGLSPHSYALLENLTLRGDFPLAGASGLRLAGHLLIDGRLSLSGAHVRIISDTTLASGEIEIIDSSFGTTVIDVAAETTLTLGDGSLVRGGPGEFRGTGTLVNQGTIRADTDGTLLTIRTGFFNNQGQLEEANGGSLIVP